MYGGEDKRVQTTSERDPKTWNLWKETVKRGEVR